MNKVSSLVGCTVCWLSQSSSNVTTTYMIKASWRVSQKKKKRIGKRSNWNLSRSVLLLLYLRQHSRNIMTCVTGYWNWKHCIKSKFTSMIPPHTIKKSSLSAWGGPLKYVIRCETWKNLVLNLLKQSFNWHYISYYFPTNCDKFSKVNTGKNLIHLGV